MLTLATHESGHTLPALLALLGLFGSLVVGACLIVALQRRSHRSVAALLTLALAVGSFGWLKSESDTWWDRRCDSGKSGCGDAPPRFPFGRNISD